MRIFIFFSESGARGAMKALAPELRAPVYARSLPDDVVLRNMRRALAALGEDDPARGDGVSAPENATSGGDDVAAGASSSASVVTALAAVELRRETRLWMAMMYKSTSQHRRAVHFQRMRGVTRSLRALAALDVGAAAVALRTGFATASPRKRARRRRRARRSPRGRTHCGSSRPARCGTTYPSACASGARRRGGGRRHARRRRGARRPARAHLLHALRARRARRARASARGGAPARRGRRRRVQRPRAAPPRGDHAAAGPRTRDLGRGPAARGARVRVARGVAARRRRRRARDAFLDAFFDEDRRRKKRARFSLPRSVFRRRWTERERFRADARVAERDPRDGPSRRGRGVSRRRRETRPDASERALRARRQRRRGDRRGRGLELACFTAGSCFSGRRARCRWLRARVREPAPPSGAPKEFRRRYRFSRRGSGRRRAPPRARGGREARPRGSQDVDRRGHGRFGRTRPFVFQGDVRVGPGGSSRIRRSRTRPGLGPARRPAAAPEDETETQTRKAKEKDETPSFDFASLASGLAPATGDAAGPAVERAAGGKKRRRPGASKPAEPPPPPPAEKKKNKKKKKTDPKSAVEAAMRLLLGE